MFSVLKYISILVRVPGREVHTRTSFKTAFPETSIFNSASVYKYPSRGYKTFTKFIHTLFSTPLRGEKQEMNF
jgi:hypothetical protein